MEELGESGVSRRDFVKAAVAIGGVDAFVACAQREDVTPDQSASSFPTGSPPAERPARQHAWSDYLVHDRFGNTINPQHQVILFLEYGGSVPPTADERATVEEALAGVERAVQWGTGDSTDAVENAGLLFTLGYANAYFDRFDTGLPETLGLPTGREVIDRLDEDATADRVDAAFLMASDYGSLLLATEQALFEDADALNGHEIPSSLSTVFERVDRRSGFIGRGLPAERLEEEAIPTAAPLSMGFKSGFQDNIPSEDKVTIRDGPFAGGTTQLISRLGLDLEAWYDRSEADRVSLMFSPHHDPETVGETGIGLAQDSGVTEAMTDDLATEAEAHGCLGHTQKAAAARDDDFDPVILRRSESIATDTDDVEFNFSSVQCTISDFIDTREAMNLPEVDAVPDACHGILSFMDVKTRGTFLLPTRTHRALPSPDPSDD